MVAVSKKTNTLHAWLVNNVRIVTLVLGSVFISTWTLLRFFSKPTIFDLVGQQVLAHQWLSGVHEGAIIGPTNYILKMLLLYMPLDAMDVSQRAKLIWLTVVINIATFVLILVLLEKIWQLFNEKIPLAFYAMMLWFALAAGSIFWIQFSNSRNLEVAGGLLLAYILLRMRTAASYKLTVLLGVLAGLVFFADPLQLYMTALPVTVFVIADIVFSKSKNVARKIAAIVGALVGGIIISRLITKLVETLFKPEFLVVANQRTHSILVTIVDSVVPFTKQALRMYSGGYELGRFAEAVTLLFVALVAVLGCYYAWKQLISRKFVSLISIVWIVNVGVYVLSGQALQGGTSRYLIMTAPFFVLFATMVIATKSRIKRYVLIITAIVLAINTVSLGIALFRAWDIHFTQDTHTNAAVQFMKSGNFRYGFASMDVALPANYLSNGAAHLLPIQCEPDGVLAPAYLFFDKAYYTNLRSSIQTETPFILDGDMIKNYPNSCDKNTIKSKLGDWISETQLSDGSTVLLYDSARIQSALFR